MRLNIPQGPVQMGQYQIPRNANMLREIDGRQFGLIPGSALGLDNNYNYAILPDGRIELATRIATDPGPQWGDTGASASYQDMPVSWAREQGFGIPDNWNPRDKQPYFDPNNPWRQAIASEPYREKSNFFWDQFAPGAAFGAMTGAIGGAAFGAGPLAQAGTTMTAAEGAGIAEGMTSAASAPTAAGAGATTAAGAGMSPIEYALRGGNPMSVVPGTEWPPIPQVNGVPAYSPVNWNMVDSYFPPASGGVAGTGALTSLSSGATTNPVSNPMSGVEQTGYATGSDPFVTESQLLPGGTGTETGFAYNMDFQADPSAIDWSGMDQYGYSGPVDPSLSNSVANNLTDAAKMLRDPLAIGGSLYQISQSKQMEDDMRNFIAQQQGKEFPHQDYYGYAQNWMNPEWRYNQMVQNPAYKASENYLIREQQRQLAAKGIHNQMNTGGNFSNNFAVPMGDVLAKNANQWDQQLFGQIRDLTGMNKNATSAEMAKQFLPSIYNNNTNAWGELIGNARKSMENGGLIDKFLRG